MKQSAALSGPLVGLRILDLSTVVAGPFAATLLADLGADVIKVELPGKGDPLRELAPHKNDVSLWWKVTNRNSGKVLDVSGDSKDDGTIIIQYNEKPDSDGNDNQRWAWVEIKGDDAKAVDTSKTTDKAAPIGRIKSKSSELVLDADSDGTIVQRSSSSKAKSQIWQIVEIKE